MLMHAHNIDHVDRMKLWEKDPANKNNSVRGDDRTPAWRWTGYLNYDHPASGHVCVPSEYIMRSIMGGAAQVSAGGKSTYKSRSQSGIIPEEAFWPLLCDGKLLDMKTILEVAKIREFADQQQAAAELGVELDVRPVKVGTSKHVRVRPRFNRWSCSGRLVIVDDSISRTVLGQILEIAGRLKGIGDWRPGGPTPGPFGTFTATIS